ncbi:MAG: hypothetical protein NTV84_07735 [Methanoregula sp.]|nr:hypothetical protein [Methanoregula sp.]
MPAAIANADKLDLVKFQRLAYPLKSLNKGELEKPDLLMDNDASVIVSQSVKEFMQGKGIPIDPW